MRARVVGTLVGLAFVVLFAGAADATYVPANGYVQYITVSNNQFATVTISNAAGSVPACHGSNPVGVYGIDLNTTAGRAQLSTLETAQVAGKRIGLGGSSTCANGVEEINLLTVYTN